MEQTKIITKKEKGTNRHWKNFIDKDYLGSHNLEKGEEMLLTIDRFEGEELVTKVGSKTEEKVPKQVLYFREDVPKMIINITNGNTIAQLYGTHPDGWIGKKIQVYATPVKAFGKTDNALRIRDFIPRTEIDATQYVAKLEAAKTLAELKAVWVTFPASVRSDAALITRKDQIKAALPQ